MHTGPMSEMDGDFTKSEKGPPCRKCGGGPVVRETWESSCGGYEDYKYTCQACGDVRWVDGGDS